MFTKLIIIAIIVTYVALAISYFLAVAIIRGPIGLDGILILLSPVILALLASIVVIAIQTGSFKSVLVYLSSTVGVWVLAYSISFVASEYGRDQIFEAVRNRITYVEARRKGEFLGKHQNYAYGSWKCGYYYSDEKLYFIHFDYKNRLESAYHKDAIVIDEDEYLKVNETEINSIPCVAWRKKDYHGWFGDVVLQIDGAAFYDIDIDELNTLLERDVNEDIYSQLRDEAEFFVEGVYDRRRYEYYWTDEKLYVFSFFTIEREGESAFDDARIFDWSLRNINPEEKGYTRVCEIKKNDKMKYDVSYMKNIPRCDYQIFYINNVAYKINSDAVIRGLVYGNDIDDITIFEEEYFYDFFQEFERKSQSEQEPE